MTRIGWRLLAVAIAVFYGLSLMATSAAKPERIDYDDYFYVTAPDNICGLSNIEIHAVGTVKFHIQDQVIESQGEGSDDFWIGVINDHGTVTHTNLDNGRTWSARYVTNINEASMVYVGDGYWEYTYAVSGMPINVAGEYKDVGRVVFTDTIYLGDLSTVEDNFFDHSVVQSISGPHPQLENDELFCDVYLSYLG